MGQRRAPKRLPQRAQGGLRVVRVGGTARSLPTVRRATADTCPFSCALQVNMPKQKNTFCKKCKKHSKMKVSQYKTGKASIFAQGEPLAAQPDHVGPARAL